MVLSWVKYDGLTGKSEKLTVRFCFCLRVRDLGVKKLFGLATENGVPFLSLNFIQYFLGGAASDLKPKARIAKKKKIAGELFFTIANKTLAIYHATINIILYRETKSFTIHHKSHFAVNETNTPGVFFAIILKRNSRSKIKLIHF